MPVGFDAKHFNVTDDDGVLVTALGAPSTDEEDFYLMLQHKHLYDEQDRQFGMDKPYIEYCGQGWSWYGHIVSFRLSSKRLQVRMDQEAASHMGNDGQIEVTFELPDAQFSALRAALRTTFTGCAYFADEA